MTRLHRTIYAVVSIAGGTIVETYTDRKPADEYVNNYANLMVIEYRAPVLPAILPAHPGTEVEYRPNRKEQAPMTIDVDDNTKKLVEGRLK